ncbi:DUF5682 family protein [Nakamurella sp.]|uniref:DUF5682 family protein n=1 Tax=Nakamurella sp. TaxID=1869182 RepID=UPI00378487C7
MTGPEPVVRVFGIRHHGPGSARAVLTALQEWEPDRVLIEGPVEADPLVAFAADPELVPPVALLAYRNDEPAAAAFWPFAVFSPEWQAVHWAAGHGVPVGFIDLPAGVLLADETRSAPDDPAVRTDPIGLLAGAAGYDDAERWWDDVIEGRRDGDPFDTFDAVTEAMTAVRAERPEIDERTLRREAHMRKVLRAAVKAGGERVAVVCGAWHAPALAGTLPGRPPTATADNARLRKLPTAKVTLTWVPWTHSRLAATSGYGAGVGSPGWYRHLFTAVEHPLERWLTRTAGVLRAHDLPTSTAHVIESVRLARTLAHLRDRPEPGLTEVIDATRAVLCDGNELAVDLVLRDAVVGEELGRVPDSAPMVPLESDLRATARSLRVKFDAASREVTLDLRAGNDLRRSHLWWRLGILGVDWATPVEVAGTGTFKEGWTVAWQPELSVRLIEASVWGTTVPAAATRRLIDRADTLAACTRAIADCITADLPAAMTELLDRLDQLAAGTADVSGLLEALPALVRAQRYGTVRGSDTAAVAVVAQAVLTRIGAGLPAALGGLGEDAAREIRVPLEATHEVVPLLPDGPARRGWYAALAAAGQRHDLPPLLAGRIVRLLMDAGIMPRPAAADRLHAALSVGSSATEKAQWAEGFTAGGALLLIHDDALLTVLDRWVRSLTDEEFLEVAPLLRRGFGTFAPAERGNLMRAAGSLSGSRAAASAPAGPDLSRAGDVLATARLLLGGGA